MEDAFDKKVLEILKEDEAMIDQKEYMPDRIQGTDGVRGKIIWESVNPLYDLVNKNFISPEFVEIYSYTFGRLLLEEKNTPKNTIIIAQDPRDKSNQFLKAAINGINKAGLDVIYIGCLPTPAVPFFIIKNESLGGIMLTASHNSYEEHGIKLFNHEGLKYLPKDDQRITEILKIIDFSSLKTTDLKNANVTYRLEESRKEFLKFNLSIWEKFNKSPNKLKDFHLIIDLSNGALTTTGKEIFKNIGVKKLITTNDNLNDLINQNCGAANLENKKYITRKEWLNKSSQWQNYQTINKIFNLAESGISKIIGLVFDGDGDRLVFLKYLKGKDAIKIKNGDYIAASLINQYKNLKGNKVVINTIESDQFIDSYAEQKGWQVVKKSVGDKWLADQIAAMEKRKIIPDQDSFIFGYEESGHFIIPTDIKTNTGKIKTLLAGNGALAALVFLSIFATQKNTDYNPGKRLSFSICYIDKKILTNPKIKHEIKETLIKHLNTDGRFVGSFKIFKDEDDLIYCDIKLKTHQNIGRIFIRNSGTENKASINLRCLPLYYKPLSNIIYQMYPLIWGKLKNFNRSENALTLEILNKNNNSGLLKKNYPNFFPKVYQTLAVKEKLFKQNDQLSVLGKLVKKSLKNL